MKKIAISIIHLYQLIISPYIGKRCRFYPSCSVYAAQAIETHGLWKGITFGIKRLLRCHPLHEGGIDLVPRREVR